MNYSEWNAQAWDVWSKEENCWTLPISHETFINVKKGEWNVTLAAERPVPKGWFPSMKGTRILGLASGGGQQMPIFTALGANVTVMDYSIQQLEAERMVAKREGYRIEIIRGNMAEPFPFEDEYFDLIFNPVSTNYIEDVRHVWRECARVLKPGGILMAGTVNPVMFLFDDDNPLQVVNPLPFCSVRKKLSETGRIETENGQPIFFSHSMEELIGGQLEAGFRLTDLLEDRDREGVGVLRDYLPTYIMTRAVKET